MPEQTRTMPSTNHMTDYKANFCPQCGSEVSDRWYEQRERAYCEACDRLIFQRPIPCANIAVVDGRQVLLIKRANYPDVGLWALPGGIMEVDEPPVDAAVRELEEETNVTAAPTDLVLLSGETVAVGDGRYNICYNYVVSRARTSGQPAPNSDAQEARFWTLDDIHETANETLRTTPDEASRIRNAIDAVHNECKP
jgi:8-oxo-dGTP diphosphatase